MTEYKAFTATLDVGVSITDPRYNIEKRNIKVAIDLDGVVAKWNERFIEFTNTLYNRSNKVDDITIWKFWNLDTIDLTEEEFFRGQDLFCKYRMWQSVEPYQYAPDALRAIDADGFEIYYLTSRPKGSERATLKFILKHGIPFGNGLIFCNPNEKAHIAGQLGISIAIDDKVETLRDYFEAGIIPIALLQKYNKDCLRNINYPDMCYSVENLKEFHHYLLLHRKSL